MLFYLHTVLTSLWFDLHAAGTSLISVVLTYSGNITQLFAVLLTYSSNFAMVLLMRILFPRSLQQEHLSNAEDFYDDSLFDLVDMLEEVLPFFSLDFFGILHSIRICLSPYKLNPFLTFLLQERADLSSSASVSPPASINAVASSRGT